MLQITKSLREYTHTDLQSQKSREEKAKHFL